MHGTLVNKKSISRMMGKQQNLEVNFFRTRSGNEPVR